MYSSTSTRNTNAVVGANSRCSLLHTDQLKSLGANRVG